MIFPNIGQIFGNHEQGAEKMGYRDRTKKRDIGQIYRCGKNRF